MIALQDANVVDAADIRMRDLSSDTHFGKESLQPHRMIGKRAREEFQRNRLAQLQIVGAIDFAHSAAPEQADDSIATREDCAWSEARARGSYASINACRNGRFGRRDTDRGSG